MSVDIPKILLTGKLRSGKSAVARMLEYDHKFVEIAFGNTLKYHADRIFSLSPAKGGGKPRALYQAFGQLCRELDPDVWVQHANFAFVMALDKRSTKGIVVSDGRQPNELAWARANGFAVVRVTAPEDVRLARARAAGDDFTAEDLTHETESYSDGFEVDYELVNDGGWAELDAKVRGLLTEIQRKEAEGHSASRPPSGASNPAS